MKLTPAVLLACAAVLCSCNTPGSRIKKNPELFNSFPPEVQEKIKSGQADIGFTREMAEMALGNPDRVYTRKTAAGETEVWAYTSYYTTTERQRVRADVRVRDVEGQYRTVRDDVWVDVDLRHEYDRVRVEFGTDGKVVSIETSSR